MNCWDMEDDPFLLGLGLFAPAMLNFRGSNKCLCSNAISKQVTLG